MSWESDHGENQKSTSASKLMKMIEIAVNWIEDRNLSSCKQISQRLWNFRYNQRAERVVTENIRTKS